MKKIRILRRLSRKVSQPPGTLIHVGEQKTETVTVSMMRYDKNTLEEQVIGDPSRCTDGKGGAGVCWVDVKGLHDVELIGKIGTEFNLHPLIQEDILNTMHNTKMEELEGHLFFVLKMLRYDADAKEIRSEQVSFILHENGVVTFQEQEGDVFEPVRERIRKNKGRIRRSGNDYLLYALMDSVVDNYFLVLDALGREIEDLENILLENPGPESLHTLHKLKQELIFLRKAVWPLREVINSLMKLESGLVKKSTGVFFRDVYDHTIQVIEIIGTYRDMAAGLQDLYLSGVSNKMNEVMKVLTIIATIFIPLTFIAGIYGMNFEFMPELKWRSGYFIIWGIMFVMAVGMVVYFKRKKWM